MGGYGFLFRSEIFFRTTQELAYILFVALGANFFFHNLTLGYMKKTESDYFFFLHQNQNILFSNIGNQNIFLEKNHNLQVKWSFPKSCRWVDNVGDVVELNFPCDGAAIYLVCSWSVAFQETREWRLPPSARRSYIFDSSLATNGHQQYIFSWHARKVWQQQWTWHQINHVRKSVNLIIINKICSQMWTITWKTFSIH